MLHFSGSRLNPSMLPSAPGGPAAFAAAGADPAAVPTAGESRTAEIGR